MPAMNTADAFLQDIIANPADDTPRLIFADWLDDQGDSERAEFIRVQCKLARHPQQIEWLRNMPVEQWIGDEEEGRLLRWLDALHVREQELARKHIKDRGRWNRPFLQACGLHPLQDDFPGQWYWKRGFVDSVACTLAAWLQHGPAIVRCQPVEVVELKDCCPVRSYFENPPFRERFCWFRDRFPVELWHYLPRTNSSVLVPTYRITVVDFDTEAEALAALSAACLQCAREQAELIQPEPAGAEVVMTWRVADDLAPALRSMLESHQMADQTECDLSRLPLPTRHYHALIGRLVNMGLDTGRRVLARNDPANRCVHFRRDV